MIQTVRWVPVLLVLLAAWVKRVSDGAPAACLSALPVAP
jgi:hypothetical protein